MISEELKNKILTTQYKSKWKFNFTNKEIIELTNHISHFEEILLYSELKWCIIYNLIERPKCLTCGKIIYYKNKKYKQFCSDECLHDPIAKNIIHRRKQQTCLKNFNVDSPSKSSIVQEKTKQTCMERYNANTPFDSDEIKEKIKQTMMERYDVDNPSKSKTIQEKRKQTFLNRYNVDNPFRLKWVQDKAESTRMLKYNVKYYSQSSSYNNQIKNTSLLVFGTEHCSQNEEFKNKHRIINRTKYWDTFIQLLQLKNIKPLFTKEEYVVYDYKKTTKKYHCDKCGKDFESFTLHVQNIYCTRCVYKSHYEYDIKQWLENELGIKNIETNRRYGKQELDILLIDYNIGIEFHGLYWHCDLNKSKYYHQEKYLFFKDKGIELIQIFENEWLQKEKDIKNIIKNKINHTNMLENLVYDKIVVLDARYDNGSEYLKLGYVEKELTEPNYFYFHKNDKILFTSKEIPEHILETFNPSKTEYKNMLDNKYLRIFDAGNIILEWRKNDK